MELEIVPAILVKERSELLTRISLVKDLVNIIQIDIMDGKFVPNQTIGISDLKNLPKANYEFHWMVCDPINWINKMPGDHMHLVHIETISSFDDIQETVRKVGGSVGLALNPETPLDKIIPYIDDVDEVLVMTVHPGFSGQTYISEMQSKIKKLRELRPELNIEVDGGIDTKTASHAYHSGANLLAAASAIF